MKHFCIALCILFANGFAFAQNTWSIKPYEAAVCLACAKMINDKPFTVSLVVKRDNANLFLVCNNREWFDKLFDDAAEGFCVEILQRNQFVCFGSNLYWSTPIAQGVLMEPCYKRDFKKRTMPDVNNTVKIRVGTVPQELMGKELEYNIILIKDKLACARKLNYNIDNYEWHLLDMGMYMDTVTYKSLSLNAQQTYTRTKSLTFTVPFEKGKFDYLPADMKALYDSLNITNFNITKMSIRAYSSVEGTEAKNVELQDKRSKSIVKALQSYQKTSIATDITSAENWVEFIADVATTKHSALATATKPDVKASLNNPETLEDLEPILQKHRKAVITIDLEQKNSLQTMTNDQLGEAFKKAIEEKNIALALMIQKQLYLRITNKTTPFTFLKTLDVPNTAEFGSIVNSNLAFNYWTNNEEVSKALQSFEKLAVLSPKNGGIRYNICVMKMKAWQMTKDITDPVRLLKEINDLKQYGIDARLIKRMLINYNVLQCEMAAQKNDNATQEKCLTFISANYKGIPFVAQDIINLAQYLVDHSKYDAAIKLLTPYAKMVDCEENLLFYYINLTIMKDDFTKKADFRNVLLNAYNVNPKRYCKLFNAYDRGGVSFQLLINDYLKNAFCESCN